MVNLPASRKPFPSSIDLGDNAPDLVALRSLCMALLADVPVSHRKAMLQRLEMMRRSDDIRHLRTVLFETISQAHGEGVARERIAPFDAWLP